MSARHLDENHVVEFVQGRMPPEVAQRAEEHIDTCEECRTLVARVTQMFATEPMVLSGLHDSLATTGSLNAHQGPPPGTLLAGRFRLKRFLGRGGMGQVYEAMDEQLKISVALKLLLPELQSAPSFLKDLHREIIVTRKITHPNVCRVYDLGQEGPLSFITMELIHGETLERVSAKRRLGSAEVVHLLEQVCLALEAAHREGVVHRDLKPGNIMLDEGGRVTVMDFGLARDLDGSQTLHSGPIGTPAYWSPEQARGEHASYRSDLYAVGLIAYEMLTGTRLSHVLEDDAPIDQVPSALKPILRRCLQVRPEQRFASAEAVRRALGAARVENKPLLRRRFAMVLGAAVGFAAAVVLLRVVERLQSKPAPEPTAALAPESAPAPGPTVLAPSTPTTPFRVAKPPKHRITPGKEGEPIPVFE